MILGGEYLKIEWGYEARTRFDWIANGWQMLAGGTWSAPDRGAAFDIRTASVKGFLKVAQMEAFVSHLESLRGQDTISATFQEGEEIFGAELDYSSEYLVHVEQIGEIELSRDNPAFASIRLSLYLAESPVLLPDAADFDLLLLGFQDSTKTISQAQSLEFFGGGAARVWDAQRNRIFKSKFRVCTTEMPSIKKAAIAARTNSFVLPNFSYKKPFGADVSGPYEVILFSWGAELRTGLNMWEIEIEFGLINGT